MNKTKMLSSQHKAIKFSFLKLLINDKSSYDKVSILSMDLPKVSFPVYFQTIHGSGNTLVSMSIEIVSGMASIIPLVEEVAIMS